MIISLYPIIIVGARRYFAQGKAPPYSYSYPIFHSPIITSEGFLFAAAKNYPKLMAFDVLGNNNGCFRWTYDFDSKITGGPIMDNDGIIYIGTMGKLHALTPVD
jgi:outer membrane protein assembly factor BamB